MSATEPSDVDVVTDLVRRQGQELLRVRNELEHSQRINDVSIEALLATERRVEALQKDSSQWRIRLTNLTEELVTLQTENNSMARELDAARVELRAVLNLSGPSSLTHGELSQNPRGPVANREDTHGYHSVSEGSELSFSGISVGSSLPEGPLSISDNNSPSLSFIQEISALDSDSLTPTNATNASNAELPAGPEPMTADEPTSRAEGNGISAEVLTSSSAGEQGPHELSLSMTDSSNLANETGLSAAGSGSHTSAPPPYPPPLASSGQVAPYDDEMRTSVVSLEPVCSNLPVPLAGKAVAELCSKALAGLDNTYHVLKHPYALIAVPNSRNHTFITVSARATNLCSNLTRFNNWKGHVLLQNALVGHLYYLGEYECGSGKGERLDLNEYDLLPEDTKQYILQSAKSVRPREIKTKEQVDLSLGTVDGIYVAKTELRFIGYSSTIENRLREEGRGRGYTRDTGKIPSG